MALVRSLRQSVTELKNPAYTGARRCWPCTVLNAVLGGILAVGIGVLVGGPTARGVTVAVAAFAVVLAVVYVRGYLVPGTPTLTRRYLPAWVMRALGKGDEPPLEDDVNVEAVVRDIGVVEDDDDEPDLVLAPAFASAWAEAIAVHAANDDLLRTGLADAVGLDPAGVELEKRPRSFVARYDGGVIARWESKAACRADVAANSILPRFDPRWERRSTAARMELLAALRLFLEECPTCRGEIALSHEVVESCCRSRDVVAATCVACNARLFEMPIDPRELEGGTNVRGGPE